MNLDDLLTRFKQEDAGQAPDNQAPGMAAPANSDLLTRFKQEDAVLNAFAAAHKTSPDEYARLRKKAIDAGMTPEQVDMFPEEAERRARYDQAVKLAQDSPKTAKWLADGENAKLGHDDADSLSAIEQTFAVARKLGRAGIEGLRQASAGSVGLARMPFDLGAAAIDPLVGTVLPENPLSRGAQWLREYQQGIAGRAEDNMPRGNSNIESGVYSGAASLTRNLAALPMAFLPGGQKATLGAMVAPVGGEAYGEARDQGLSMPRALSYAGSQATTEYFFEKIPLVKLMGDLKAGTPFFKTLLNNAIREVPGEQATTILQDLNSWAVLPENADKPFSEYLAERPDAAVQTLVATLVGTGGQVTVMDGIGKAVGYAEQRAIKAQQAEESAAFVENINKLAAADKLLQRDPDTFEAFVAAAAEDGPVQQVYIDGKTLMQSGLAPELAKASPAVAAQLDRAILTGGQIAIPVDEYAARIAPTDLAPQLLDHLKTEPDGFSRAEAQDYMQNAAPELQAEVERILADKQGDDSFKASSEAVRGTIKTQLDTAARFTPQVNDAYSAMVSDFYAVTAAKLGITPEELYQRYPLKVGAEPVAGGQQFDQAGFRDTLAKAKEAIRTAVGLAKNNKRYTSSHEILPVFDAEVAEAASAGLDISGYRHAIDGSAIRHTFKNHGDEKVEQARGLIPVTDADMEAIPDILTAPDKTIYGLKNDIGRDMIVYLKTMADGTTLYLEEVRTGRKTLTAQSMRRYPRTTSAASIEKALHPTSETLPGDAFTINEHPVPRNADAFKQGERGSFSPDTLAITLLKNADLSTFLHESGHFFLEVQADIAATLQHEAKVFGLDALKPGERQILADMDALLGWFGVRGGEAVHLNAKDRVNGAELADMARGFNMTPSALVAAWKAKPPKPNSSQGVLWGKLDGMPELALFAAENPGAVSRMGLETGTALDVWHNLTLDEKRSYHEQFARGFEAYLFEGNAPSIELQGLFQRFRAWLLNVYRDLKAINVELSDEVRGVFDRMLASNEQIQLAEQGRSMMPLFRTQADAENVGMTPEEFAAYQALGVDATNEAIQDLQGRGLRDMQWLHNTRGRVIKQLKKASAARRAEMQMDARREVMSQPLYRAWDFLTRKLTDNDKLPPLERKSDPDVLDPTLDSLFVAIAKLGGIRKDQVLSEWGVDPKDMPQSGLFGKPVWRIKDGLTLDGMAEALAEHGYLPLNEHGQYELNDLGDRFLEELAGNPQYSHAYQPQDLLAGRLDLAALAAMGVPDEVVSAVKARRMTAADGLHPDLVAELYGFSSGDELVRALAAAETPKAEIDALTDVRMLENYGELSSPEAIEKAADRAIHNDVRARMVATEANALAKATGRRRVLASAAKEYAAAMIARLKVRAIKPGQYANAEVRAARAAEKASKAGDIATAAAEKSNQLVNTYATRAAYDALDEVDAGLRYLKKFGKISKTLDPDYQDQIDAMLERFDLKPVSNKALDKRKSLAQWIEAQREAGLEPDIAPEMENEANRKSYKDITVEEFRGLVDTVQQIEHLGRLKHKLLTAQDQRAFGVIVDEVAAGIVENGGAARPVELETPTGIRPWLEGFAAGHRKLASLIRQMDGLKDNGPFWRVLVRGMNEAATNEAVMNEQATVKLAELYKPLLDMKGGLNGDKQFIPEINDSLTRGGRLSVALNWGNATNRARIMDGDGWSEAQVDAILRRLTRAEWDFVNGMWAYIDSYWPQIEAKEKRVTGRAPDKVKADPFSFTVDGETIQLTGGYYPIKYDSNRDDRAEKLEAAEVAKDMMRGAFTRSTTRRGHTKARVEDVRRPVKKTLDVITQHVSEVTHDLAWHEWLIDANRLLNAKPINQAIREHYGTEVIRTMKDALTSIATADSIPMDASNRALLYLRANVSRSTMGFSLTTAFLQPFGLSQSMVRIGSKHVLRGMARWAGDAARFESSMTWIGEKSDFMRLRNKTFNRELHEIKGRVSKGHSQARTIYDASLFMLMQKMQMVADVPTWIGAYEKALAENHDDATAVSLADQAVLDSQGGGQTKDMAQVQLKHPWMTMFYSYFNTTLNLAAESTAQTDFKNPLAVAGWASDMALLMVIPALAPAMLLALMRGEDCGGVEECSLKLARAQAGYLLNLMWGVRELSGITSGFDYAGPPVGRVVTELSRTGTQVAQGEADEAAAMSAVSLLGVSLGIPTTQILRSWRGWNAWEEGDAPASSILLGPPPKD